MAQSLGDCSEVVICLVFPIIYGKIWNLSEKSTEDCYVQRNTFLFFGFITRLPLIEGLSDCWFLPSNLIFPSFPQTK